MAVYFHNPADDIAALRRRYAQARAKHRSTEPIHGRLVMAMVAQLRREVRQERRKTRR